MGRRPSTRLRARTTALVAAATLLGSLAACSGGDDPEATEPPSSSSPTPTPSPEPTADPGAIRDADLANTTWSLDQSPLAWPLNPPAEVALADGAGTVEGWSYEAREVVYADADGDGDEDALASLFIMMGNETATQWYAWEWDAEAEQAVQLVDVVAQAGMCHDAVSSVAPANGGFSIAESLTESWNVLNCEDPGSLDRSRVVGIAEGVPVRIDGPGGWGGVCGFPASEIMRDAAAGEQAPDGVAAVPGGALAAEAGELTGLVVLGAEPSGGAAIERDGWNQVGYAVDGVPGSDQQRLWPCGWVQLAGG
ncbi:hypothetical protein Bcav_3059 [Beutenbergia cavernae DSM 12333]|uniref:Secreted protein n=1 Tax=Beutenbergia cavernae (strain ATCC BAA-8 / DSM 12333 / CCUG 43141 / JCM 11478 / NBRC 16432 / NCIMB 13614 / HKI 0122) TaxID=471853 RepID=C5BZX3_BEUC1|nr:hypothetical protein [Beutenbergia cavernae]ACQ81303.1 hypothetical protein Bcav_3059 [Beutenbergia cavernae DSM 12333]